VLTRCSLVFRRADGLGPEFAQVALDPLRGIPMRIQFESRTLGLHEDRGSANGWRCRRSVRRASKRCRRWPAVTTRAPLVYKNCTNLNKRYPRGVGKLRARDSTSGTPVTNFRRSTRLYQHRDELQPRSRSRQRRDRLREALTMGFGFRKRKRIFPGLSLNLSKSGIGLSAGRRGATVSQSPTGRRQLSLGWKGLFFRKRL
jgi:hypothetical protein